jgi:hypothetical protein
MTHDELLKRVQYNQGYQMGLDGYKICSALRAVVELHRPLELVSSSMCLECSSDDSVVSYPCPTINNIEKELA